MACFRSSSDGGDGRHSYRYYSYSVTTRACNHIRRRFGVDSARRQIGSGPRVVGLAPDVTPDELQVQFLVASCQRNVRSMQFSKTPFNRIARQG